jgi:serine phosphatase RsbU (regulator of sigma subunit)
MAIQNDRLQHEMVERERLGREFQLARQIQRTFLPHHLPELPGWSMDVRWRTAREVGGDFYDVFDLPDGRLGLVMADVADKGMPAALFMILVRTLVRATVQGVVSPAEVLARVNDVLVPDAQQGMFVTLVYAVLDTKTGELVYGNAGHNPPLLLRNHSLSVERLEKGGMAIGVLDGSRVEEHSVQIEAGDYLVFYTDGVTEAFSPEGDMYGEERLEATIRGEADWVTDLNVEVTSGTAGEMLEAIDDSVCVFVGDSLPFDDLSLMVLRRLSA